MLKAVLSRTLRGNAFIHDILRMDKEVYPAEMLGSFESVSRRYEKNHDSYILIQDETGFVGYMCFFPVSKELHDKLLFSDAIFDDNIGPESICEYSPQGNNLFIISMVIVPRHQNSQAVMLLQEKFKEFISEKIAQGLPVRTISAISVSPDGEKMLIRLGFECVKRYCADEALYAYSLKEN